MDPDSNQASESRAQLQTRQDATSHARLIPRGSLSLAVRPAPSARILAGQDSGWRDFCSS